jgi:hypothetical protein
VKEQNTPHPEASNKAGKQDLGGGEVVGPRQNGGNAGIDVEEVVRERLFSIEIEADAPGEGVAGG